MVRAKQSQRPTLELGMGLSAYCFRNLKHEESLYALLGLDVGWFLFRDHDADSDRRPADVQLLVTASVSSAPKPSTPQPSVFLILLESPDTQTQQQPEGPLYKHGRAKPRSTAPNLYAKSRCSAAKS